MTSDLIRQAETQDEVFALLDAFIDSCCLWDKTNLLPAAMAARPADFVEVGERCLLLLNELDAASRGLDERRTAMLKEALRVYAAAFDRLNRLKRELRRCSGYEAPARERRKRSRQHARSPIVIH